jgi:hypothetical protein
MRIKRLGKERQPDRQKLNELKQSNLSKDWGEFGETTAYRNKTLSIDLNKRRHQTIHLSTSKHDIKC